MCVSFFIYVSLGGCSNMFGFCLGAGKVTRSMSVTNKSIQSMQNQTNANQTQFQSKCKPMLFRFQSNANQSKVNSVQFSPMQIQLITFHRYNLTDGWQQCIKFRLEHGFGGLDPKLVFYNVKSDLAKLVQRSSALIHHLRTCPYKIALQKQKPYNEGLGVLEYLEYCEGQLLLLYSTRLHNINLNANKLILLK